MECGNSLLLTSSTEVLQAVSYYDMLGCGRIVVKSVCVCILCVCVEGEGGGGGVESLW